MEYLDFYCPPEAAYMEEMRCNATVLAGTYLNLTIDYGDGVTEVFAIAGDLHENYHLEDCQDFRFLLAPVTRNSK